MVGSRLGGYELLKVTDRVLRRALDADCEEAVRPDRKGQCLPVGTRAAGDLQGDGPLRPSRSLAMISISVPPIARGGGAAAGGAVDDEDEEAGARPAGGLLDDDDAEGGGGPSRS